MNDIKRQIDDALSDVSLDQSAGELIGKYQKRRKLFCTRILTSAAAFIVVGAVVTGLRLNSNKRPIEPPIAAPTESDSTSTSSQSIQTSQTSAQTPKAKKSNSEIKNTNRSETGYTSPQSATEDKENTVVKKSSDQQSTRPAENTPKKPEKKTNPAETENATQPATQSETNATAPTSAPNPQFAPEREDMYTVYFFTPESFDDKVQLMCIDSNQSYSFEDLQATDYNPSIYYAYVQKDKKSLCVTRKENSSKKTQFLNNLNKSELCDDKIFVLTFTNTNRVSEFGSQDSYRVKTRMYYYYGDDLYGEYPTLSEAQEKGAVYSAGKND